MNTVDIVIPVKNAGPNLTPFVTAWLGQKLPAGWTFQLFVVDDGSTDGEPGQLALALPNHITLISHDQSRGRAAACNAGAAAGKGSFVAFFDADCYPGSENVLSELIEATAGGAQVAFGHIEAAGNGFWKHHLNDIARNREKRFLAGDGNALTTANCIIERNLFQAAGRFDERYKHYGFEDRDLIVRLNRLGAKVTFKPDAVVIHGDKLNLHAICNKMRAAGRFTAGIFMQAHPTVYRNMQFHKADVRCHGAHMRLLGRMLGRILPIIEKTGSGLLKAPLPYVLKATIVRMCSGIYFMVGTSEAEMKS